jgi:hypothetical protein
MKEEGSTAEAPRRREDEERKKEKEKREGEDRKRRVETQTSEDFCCLSLRLGASVVLFSLAPASAGVCAE